MVQPEASAAPFVTAAAGGAVDLLLIDLDPGRPVAAVALGLLSEEERQRAARLRRPEDRERFVAARAALRMALGERLDLPPESLRFVLSGHGKPGLEEHDVAFNISHAGRRIALAIGTASVGVDVERIGRPADPLRLARACLAGEEVARLEVAVDPSLEFARIWTAKEAVLKAVGSGFAIPLESFTVPPASGDWQPIVESRDDALCDFAVATIDAGDGYAGAIATIAPGKAITTRWLTFDEAGALIAAPERSAATG